MQGVDLCIQWLTQILTVLTCLHLSLLFAMNNSDLGDLPGEDVVDDVSLEHISMVFSLQKNFSNFSFFSLITLPAVNNRLGKFMDPLIAYQIIYQVTTQ